MSKFVIFLPPYIYFKNSTVFKINFSNKQDIPHFKFIAGIQEIFGGEVK